MTRKDFILIAAALLKAREAIKDKEPPEAYLDLLDGVGYATDYLADALAATNERFDRARFIAAATTGAKP